MIYYLINLFLLTFAIENLASLITESYIFSFYRERVEKLKDNIITTKLKYSSTCHQCTSQQLALLISFFLPIFPLPLPSILIYFLNALIIGRLSYLLHSLYEKLIFSQGINVFHTQFFHKGESIKS